MELIGTILLISVLILVIILLIYFVITMHKEMSDGDF